MLTGKEVNDENTINWRHGYYQLLVMTPGCKPGRLACIEMINCYLFCSGLSEWQVQSDYERQVSDKSSLCDLLRYVQI